MIVGIVNNVLTNFIVSLGLDAIIFNIIYSVLNIEQSYLRKVIVYTICLLVKLMIMEGITSFQMFLMAFGLYFVIGLILIWLLNKIVDGFSRISFIGAGIILQNVIFFILQFII